MPLNPVFYPAGPGAQIVFGTSGGENPDIPEKKKRRGKFRQQHIQVIKESFHFGILLTIKEKQSHKIPIHVKISESKSLRLYVNLHFPESHKFQIHLNIAERLEHSFKIELERHFLISKHDLAVLLLDESDFKTPEPYEEDLKLVKQEMEKGTLYDYKTGDKAEWTEFKRIRKNPFYS